MHMPDPAGIAVAIPLYGPKAAGRVALVDPADCGLVAQYRWRIYERHAANGGVFNGPYAQANRKRADGNYTVIFMHKLITGYKRTDHIDHDGLNNQRSNLRPATTAQNNHNQRPQRGTSSRFKGVTWHKANRKWQAEIKVGGKRHYLGTYTSEEEAALAYNAAALGAFGEYAYLNEGAA